MLIANRISLIRIVCAPVFAWVYLFFVQRNNYAALLIVFICLIFVELTDFLDGFIARKLKQVSDIGKLLDPFADTMLHISLFFCFTVLRYMPPLIFLALMYREFAMLFIRMVSIKNGTAIAARMGGKLKTILYITTCFYTLALDIYAAAECSFLDNIQAFITGRTILYGLSALAAYISFVDYLIHFGAALKGKK